MTLLKFPQIRRASVLSGLGLGLVIVVLYTLVYLIHRPSVLSPFLYWGSLLVYFPFMWRINQQTFTGFRVGVANVFLVYFLANALYYLFYFVLMRYVDPGLIDLQFEKMQASRFVPEGIERADLVITGTSVFFGFCRSLIGGFILAGLMVYWKMRD